jgi:hypothetical protein
MWASVTRRNRTHEKQDGFCLHCGSHFRTVECKAQCRDAKCINRHAGQFFGCEGECSPVKCRKCWNNRKYRRERCNRRTPHDERNCWFLHPGQAPGCPDCSQASTTRQPIVDTKATDAKATDTKATDAKATDTKATDAKATDTKATDAKAIVSNTAKLLSVAVRFNLPIVGEILDELKLYGQYGITILNAYLEGSEMKKENRLPLYDIIDRHLLIMNEQNVNSLLIMALDEKNCNEDWVQRIKEGSTDFGIYAHRIILDYLKTGNALKSAIGTRNPMYDIIDKVIMEIRARFGIE